MHSKAFLRSLTQTHVSVNGVDSWCCRFKLRSTCSQDKDKLGWVILPKLAKLPHATSCGGYNVFDPSVRQFCFSLMMKIDRLLNSQLPADVSPDVSAQFVNGLRE